MYVLSYPWGGPHIFEFPGGGGQVLPLAPPPLRAPMYRPTTVDVIQYLARER